MINLDSTSDKLQVVTSAATAVDVHISYVDRDPTFSGATELAPLFSPASVPTAISTQATTDVLAAPGASIQRNAKFISVANKDASVSNTITVQHVTGAGTFRLFKCTLAAGESLISRDGSWFLYDATGNVKTSPGTTVAAATVDPHINDFRLTGTTATPIMTADSTSLSTIYCSPYKGQRMALYDGSAWQLGVSAEVSLAVTARTTDLPFDIFAYLVGSVITLEFLDWTNSTTRATALVRQDGIWCKTGALTRRYLGSCRPRSATTFHWVAAGVDLPCKFDLFNMDNRVETAFTLIASTNTWNYTLATWRQAQASTNYQVDIMVGLQEENFEATVMATSTNASTTVSRQVGVGFDSTTAFSGLVMADSNPAAVASECSSIGRIKNMPSIGRHFYAWLEISTATGTTTWFGDNGALRHQSGVTGTWVC